MDSEKRGNLAIGLALIMGIPNWIMLSLMLWFRWYPDPSKGPEIMPRFDALVTGWLPIVVVSTSSALSALVLLTVALKRWRNGRLTAEISSLTTDIINLKKERQDAWDRAKEATQDALKAREDAKADAKEAALRENQLRGEREGISKLYYEGEQKLADLAGLKQLAEAQAKNISDHVVILSRPPGSLILSKSPRVITIGLKIKNESVFSITIDPKEVRGCLHFDGTPLHEAASQLVDDSRWPITNLRPGQMDMIVLKQPLLKSEAETIAECENGDTRFWLGNLHIPISVLNSPISVEPQRLRIHTEVEYVALKDFGNTNNP